MQGVTGEGIEAARDGPWGWQFGGHHLAINMTVADERSTLSPTFVGVEPGRYATAAGTVAPLAEHRAAGLAIMNALDEIQRRHALLDARPRGNSDGRWQGRLRTRG